MNAKTRTVRFFLQKYRRPTILAAVDAAARQERLGYLPGFEDFAEIAVEVEAIAAARRIQEVKAVGPADSDATLFTGAAGHSLRWGSTAAVYRRRFTIAHEIGHTLFLEGERHQVGVLNRREMEAEERICDLFAGALLMPTGNIRKLLQDLPSNSPWATLMAIERTALRLKVSLPALLCRMGQVEGPATRDIILLCLRLAPNPRTGDSPCLRVESCSSIGKLKDTLTWSGKSAAKLGLRAADDLFKSWAQTNAQPGERAGGRFTLTGEIVRPAASDTLRWVPETLMLDVHSRGGWHKEPMMMLTSSSLYAAKGWGMNSAYVVSLVKPLIKGPSEPAANFGAG